MGDRRGGAVAGDGRHPTVEPLPEHAAPTRLVQETLVRALNHIDTFEADRPGAFLAYLRPFL
ncbi:MAG: hypothetical protein E6K76_11540 [Candidatus Eisenbacteria bacterium]|uniref:Uncharacterized protein n=1 Tax=Eiseniibacteriota bacterium TaxID=2212470 RepID=A0A538T0B8_UNCEI|nr:MAG: hypothetical protein E6K76_11540 [Candidatus Eisenbacteria bacterium]